MTEERLTSRQSNIELLRIVLMLLIIAHHSVVNSGVTDCFDYHAVSGNMLFLQFFGAFGKIGVNCFVLITGYFMVTSKISAKKWLKLYLEVKFYTLLFYILFLLSGKITFNYHEALETIFSVVFGIGNTFADTFLVLYLLIPFINLLIEKLSQRSFALLLGLLLVVMTVIPSFALFLSVMHRGNDTWGYLPWMVVIYMIGAFIRLNQDKVFEFGIINSTFRRLASLIGSIILVFLWIVFYDFIGSRHDMGSPYWFVNDANKLLAVITSVLIFIFFLRTKIKNTVWINRIAATTFGVFLIHTSGDYMREFLWQDVFHCRETYSSRWLPLMYICMVFIVFIGCVMIDLGRSSFLERPLFHIIDSKDGKSNMR